MSRDILKLSGILLLIILMTQPVLAFTSIESSETVIIDDTIEDDILVAGNKIIIKGIIKGDVIVAGGSVDVSGNITEDLIIAAGEVSVTGNIGDDMRVASGTVIIEGNVEDDLISLAGETKVSDTGRIGGDLTSASGHLDMQGNVEGNVSASGDEVTIGGKIDGNVDINTEDLTVLPGAYISGNLEYRTHERANIPEGTVGKDIRFIEEQYGDEDDSGSTLSSVIWWIISYMALLLIGLLGIAILPEGMRNISSKTSDAPGRAFLLGLAIMIVSMVVVVLLFITLIGIPLGIIILILVITCLYIARIITAIWIGNYLFAQTNREPGQMADLALGLFILLLLGEIPFIGGLIYLIATLIPVGNIFEIARK